MANGEQTVLNVVEAAGVDGLIKSQLTNQTPSLSAEQRDAAIERLILQNQVRTSESSTGGRPSTKLIATKFAELDAVTIDEPDPVTADDALGQFASEVFRRFGPHQLAVIFKALLRDGHVATARLLVELGKRYAKNRIEERQFDQINRHIDAHVRIQAAEAESKRQATLDEETRQREAAERRQKEAQEAADDAERDAAEAVEKARQARESAQQLVQTVN